jgi:hypothetical protein
MKGWLGKFLIAVFFLLVTKPVSLAAPAPAGGFGRSFDEVVALAKKEGKVLIGSGLAEDEAQTVLGAFTQKYPEIKIENTRLRTPEHKMKVFNELIGGRVEFDVLDISSELMGQFKKADVLSGPFDWRAIFSDSPKNHFSPDGYFAAGAYGLKPIAYNPELVPRERIPKDWADCTDPYWKGRFVVDTSAKYVVTLYPGWGEEKLLSWAKTYKGKPASLEKRDVGSDHAARSGRVPYDLRRSLSVGSPGRAARPTGARRGFLAERSFCHDYRDDGSLERHATPERGALARRMAGVSRSAKRLRQAGPRLAVHRGHRSLTAGNEKWLQAYLCGMGFGAVGE